MFLTNYDRVLLCLSQVHTFYKTWAETYEDDMNKLNFTGELFSAESKSLHHLLEGAGLLAEMLTSALSRSGKNDVSKVNHGGFQPDNNLESISPS